MCNHAAVRYMICHVRMIACSSFFHVLRNASLTSPGLQGPRCWDHQPGHWREWPDTLHCLHGQVGEVPGWNTDAVCEVSSKGFQVEFRSMGIFTVFPDSGPAGLVRRWERLYQNGTTKPKLKEFPAAIICHRGTKRDGKRVHHKRETDRGRNMGSGFGW